MARLFLVLIGIIALSTSAQAGTEPEADLWAQPVSVAYVAPEMHILAQPTIAFLSTDRADVLQSIGAMRAQLSDFAEHPPETGISSAVDSYAQHWDLVIDASVSAQQTSLDDMIGGLVDTTQGSILDFLEAPPMIIEPSLFQDPDFRQAQTPADFTGGFFAP